MAKRIAINGFGRIGRLFYRSLYERNFFNGQVEVVVVNDLAPADNLAYLLKYDSTQGNMHIDVTAENDEISVGSHRFKVLSQKASPHELPWKDHGIDLVIEATGIFTKYDDAKGHITAGANRVIVSAPSDDATKTFIVGVNDGEYAGEDVISNASCTTNCIVPLVHVLLKEGIGIKEGLMTTNHSYTATQMLVDGISKKDFRGGRAGAINIIPASTGAAKAVSQVYPELEGKLTGMAFRVPTPTVSVVDLTFKPVRPTSMAEINSLMKRASETYLNTILGYTEEPVVSSDFIHDPRSSIYDATAGIELNPEFFKLIAWYDNEWGYVNRLADLVGRIANSH